MADDSIADLGGAGEKACPIFPNVIFSANGGQVNDEKRINPEEPRGESITGGRPHHLVKGDVIVIPNGIPHWFEQANDFKSFMVKIRAGN